MPLISIIRKLYLVFSCSNRKRQWRILNKTTKKEEKKTRLYQLRVNSCISPTFNFLVWHVRALLFEPPRDKTNQVSVRPAKTQISLGIRPVWSESSLCVQWVAKDPSFLHADSEDSDQIGRMPRLIWVFAGRTTTLLVLTWGGPFCCSLQLVVKTCPMAAWVLHVEWNLQSRDQTPLCCYIHDYRRRIKVILNLINTRVLIRSINKSTRFQRNVLRQKLYCNSYSRQIKITHKKDGSYYEG